MSPTVATSDNNLSSVEADEHTMLMYIMVDNNSLEYFDHTRYIPIRSAGYSCLLLSSVLVSILCLDQQTLQSHLKCTEEVDSLTMHAPNS